LDDRVDITAVIPVHNEEENIKDLYLSLKKVLGKQKKEYEIVFVDDGSTDSSFDILEKLAEKDGRVVVVKFRRNFGQTSAISAGFDVSRGDAIVTIDSDLQNDPEDIPKLLEILDSGFDLVSGWRKERKDKPSKKIFSSISNKLARLITGIRIHDFGCTLKAYKRETLEDVVLFGEMHRYIPAIVAWNGYKITECEVTHHPRRHGKSKYGIWRLIRGFLDLLNIRFWMSFSSTPLYFFGFVGLAQFVLGCLMGLYFTIKKVFYGMPLADKPVLLLSVLLIVLGFQFITLGFLGESMVRIHYEGLNKKTYRIEKILGR